jgi:hypothetical protein
MTYCTVLIQNLVPASASKLMLADPSPLLYTGGAYLSLFAADFCIFLLLLENVFSGDMLWQVAA